MSRRPSFFKNLAGAAVLWLVFTGLAGVTNPVAMGAPGNVEPFSLHVQALKGKGSTDLLLQVLSRIPGYSLPTQLSKVLVQSTGSDGKRTPARNFFGVPLDQEGRATLRLGEMGRFQPLEVTALISTEQTVDREVLRVQAETRVRPDLIIDRVAAPETVAAGNNFTVEVVIREMNGDLGAMSDVAIMNGTEVLDLAGEVMVPAGGTQAVVFWVNLSNPGTYTLTAGIQGAVPADFDASNNTASFTITALADVLLSKPMTYRSSYERAAEYTYAWDRYRNLTDPEPYAFYRETGMRETLSLTASTSEIYELSGTFTLEIGTEKGPVNDLEITGIVLTDAYRGVTGFRGFQKRLPELNGFLEVVQKPWGTELVFFRSAGQVSYSMRWEDYWGEGDQSYGSFLGAGEFLSVTFDLPDVSGNSYGGSYLIGLQSEVQERDDWYEDGWGHVHEWSTYHIYQGNAEGITVRF